MQTIQPIQIETASGLTLRLLENLRTDGSPCSNMIRTMAKSPETLEGYLQFSRSLKRSILGPKFLERIALTVARAYKNGDYCLALHAALAARLGMTSEEIRASCDALAADKKTEVALEFVYDLVTGGRECSITELREAGYGDSEIIEIIAQVGLSVFENYLNMVAKTELDFPPVASEAAAA